MPPPQGLFEFPGVAQIIRGDFTLSHGISPSVATVDIAPQAGLILTDGTLTVRFDQTLLRFPGCKVNSPSIRWGEGGRVLSFSILDRRWRWAYGEIYGRYNIKRADGKIDTLRSQEKTPQELARLLLEAMGEQGYDVSALPTKSWRPESVWDGHNPAEQLAQLCDLLGCRVVLGIDNRVRIVRAGSGRDLPVNPLRRAGGDGLSITGFPDSLKVVCGPTLWQSKLKLEAVGLDSDGRVKPIDELSYTPTDPTTGAAEWTNQSPDGFYSIENKADRRLALRTVFRWYRVVSQADGTLTPPGFPEEVKNIRQLLPLRGSLLEYQLDQQRDAQDLQSQHYLPAHVEGSFLKRDFTFGTSLLFSDIQRGASTDSNGNTSIGARYTGGFSLDEERGIVMFSEWVAKRKDSGGYEEAELYLACSYACVQDKTHLPLRFGISRKLARQPQGTGPRVIPAPDIFETIIARYDPTGKKISESKRNTDDVRRWCNELLEAAQAEYQIPATEEVEYAGFLPIAPDGAIHQVQWSFGPQGAVTRASSNTEFDLATPDYRERREQQRIRAIQGQVFREPVVEGAR